ncbi:MAG: phosphoenolpyruvate carboxykinase (ATP) [Planctomycetia bacterium]|nr:phosphoenolpyruvate carboxykinase (ATP) [Planctomycetia bacterium]
MPVHVDLSAHEISVPVVVRNASPARLYEDAVTREQAGIVSSGAIAIRSGAKTGRSPKDKHVVRHPDSDADVWWGAVNHPIDDQAFLLNRQRAIDYLNTRDQIYVCDGFAGWDPSCRLRIRVLCARAYHALYMQNMLIRPTSEELERFGQPDYVIFNAGQFPAAATSQTASRTSIDLSLERREQVILGTEYAGEMKKGVFTIMHWLLPGRDVLSMHCAANCRAAGPSAGGSTDDVSLFFGLSGTGKTTLSADPARRLIGDDEHGWGDDGIFNIEGGCYAKCINLSAEKEPEIYRAIRFGTVLENVVYDPATRVVDFRSSAITENTRAAYPIDFIDNARVPCVAGHPRNVIFLTCDASGVLPPVSRLSKPQAMYHFLSGYTARVAGTEMGVVEPQVAFSACFSAAFLVRHPAVYARMLADRLERHGARAWLVNTGWTGGAYGQGRRIDLAVTRRIIDAINGGLLDDAPVARDRVFGLDAVVRVPGVDDRVLLPHLAWSDESAWHRAALGLAARFRDNFAAYAEAAGPAVVAAGPAAGG